MSADVEAIKDALKRWVDAINARRADAVSDLVSNDVVFIHPPAAPFAGKDAIARLYRAAFRVFDVQERLHYEDIRIVGALATARVTEHLQLKPVGGGTVVAYTETDAMRFRHAKGGWKLVSRSLAAPSPLLLPFAHLAQRPAAPTTTPSAKPGGRIPPGDVAEARAHEQSHDALRKVAQAALVPSNALYRWLVAHG